MRRIILNENQFNRILESSSYFEIPLDADITSYVRQYLNWSQMGEMDATFSIEASKLHYHLMDNLELDQTSSRDRRIFVNILKYIRLLDERVGVTKIESCSPLNKYRDHSYWVVYTNIDGVDDNQEGHHWIRPINFEDDIYDMGYLGIVFKTVDGVERLKSSYHERYDGDMGGYRTDQARMTDEMKQKIYDMGLVPALYESGSCHENYVYAVGILPDYVRFFKDDDDYYFDCEF